jgi:hypothetical protein
MCGRNGVVALAEDASMRQQLPLAMEISTSEWQIVTCLCRPGYGQISAIFPCEIRFVTGGRRPRAGGKKPPRGYGCPPPAPPRIGLGNLSVLGGTWTEVLTAGVSARVEGIIGWEEKEEANRYTWWQCEYYEIWWEGKTV